ncbi:hypothetical protein QAD02_005412 [Eretmocerus hayati]|uniref:Uncharacterized protein n=1 Tax=Eretmocerus hayati TaxID=131215 RepID=A0ACC2NSG8_9HYME|nr:hypothetical protein QAD02_005412 [Eretmocerus hayati]
MKRFHPKRDKLDLPCGESGCLKIFQTFGSRSLHRSRYHRKLNRVTQSSTTPISHENIQNTSVTTSEESTLLTSQQNSQDAESCALRGMGQCEDRISMQSKQRLQTSEDQEENCTLHTPLSDSKTTEGQRLKRKLNSTVDIPELQSNNEVIAPTSTPNLDIADIEMGETSSSNITPAFRDEKKAAAFNLILDLRTKNISNITIRSILSHTEKLVHCGIQEFVGVAQTALLKHGIDLSQYMDIPEEIQECSRSFDDLRTKWKQDQYIRKMKSFIRPRKILLDSVVKKRKQSHFEVNRSLQIDVEKLIYISLTDIIISFLEEPRYQELLEFYQSTEVGVFKQFSDGSNFKSNQLFQQNPHSLPIFLYYDDMNLTDTASNRPTKMAMFYFTFGNLKATHKSSTKFIYLLLPVEQDIFKSYPLKNILKCIVEDLQKLENGIKLANGNIFHGTLAAFLGDNLASHRIGGFKTGFTAEHPCRVCMATLDQVRKMVREDPTLLRTVDEYNAMIEKLKACKTKQEYDKLSKEYGLNEECPFNELEHFHAVNGIPPDLFHDIFEGSLALTLHLLLIHFLKGPNKVMTLDEFNTKMLDFDFGYSETKPSQILSQHLDESAKLHQTGSQMWSLALITPLILGPVVPLKDKFWANYILLLEITALICGYSVSLRMVGYLQVQIETYLRTFQELYERHLIPKQHFLLHYLTYMMRFGPLYNFNTLRMEAKHQYFKEMMRKLKNLKNPPVTMTEQHQWYQVSVSEGFVDEDENGPIRKNKVDEFPFATLLPKDVTEVFSMSWLTSHGVKFIPRECFVMTSYCNNVPEFSLVESIICLDDNPILVCRKAVTSEFDLHYSAYSIQMTQEYQLKSTAQLYCPSVFHVHRVRGDNFIIVKRAVGDLY